MIDVNRRRFLFRSAAIVAASNLMPGHSIAKVLEPTPRETIVANMQMIEQEMQTLGWPGWSTVLPGESTTRIRNAINNICMTGVDKLATPSKESVAKCFGIVGMGRYTGNTHDNFRDVPVDVLPIHALKIVLGRWKTPVTIRSGDNDWSKFVDKYADTLPGMSTQRPELT